jgi:hypothetical protein
MNIEDLNKSQLILLAILISFVTSIATGITTVTLMDQAPKSVTLPITRVVQQTVEKIVPAEYTDSNQSLSSEQQKLLEDLKAIKPLTVNLFLKVGTDGKEDKLLGTGLFLGNDKIVVASLIPKPKEGETYVIKSVLGEQKVAKITQEKDFTIIELVKIEPPVIVDPNPNIPPVTPEAPVTPAI